jgi:hypothetical protein
MSDSLDANQSAETENKQRRLVPQFSLNNRHEPKQIHHEAPKKSGRNSSALYSVIFSLCY